MTDITAWTLAYNSPTVIWDNFKDTFDSLYAESATRGARMIDLTLHAHVAGRPTLIPTIRSMLRYAQAHEGMWFAPNGYSASPAKCS